MNAMSVAHAALAEDTAVQPPADTHPLFQPVADGIIDVQGVPHMRTSEGGLMPVAKIKPQDILEDEMVRKVLGFALPLSGFLARFKQHTFNDGDQLVELLDQNYGAKRGGKAGNLTFTSFDNLMKVELARAKIIDFGSSLVSAKALLDECVADWADKADANLKALVTRAFNVENGGLINRAALLGLLRYEIDDDRWKRAMQAINDAIIVTGTKRYVRIYHRPSTDDAWVAVSLDAARA